MPHPQPSRLALDLEILRQPDDASCGPTCLQAVYQYYGDQDALADVVAEVPRLQNGGTLSASLAIHALRRGYRALMYTYNLAIFDPTWLQGESRELAPKLRAQAQAKRDPRLSEATEVYLEYLRLGGELQMEDLTPGLLRRWLESGRPILTGLSSTYLYRSAREVGRTELAEDDVAGVPTGHFVVLSGWDEEDRTVRVADPVEDHPHFQRHVYWVPVQRLINAILLGVLTHDGNLLVLEPPGERS
ncbi:MAG: cysteine peptidase family C39 domain-containing protein [bacterium]